MNEGAIDLSDDDDLYEDDEDDGFELRYSGGSKPTGRMGNE
jgi:hypothetical protein